MLKRSILIALSVILAAVLFTSCVKIVYVNPTEAPDQQKTGAPEATATAAPTEAPVHEETAAPTQLPETGAPATDVPATAVPDGVTEFGITMTGDGVQSVMGTFQITKGGTYYATGKSDPGCDVQININAPGQEVTVKVENLEINNNTLRPVFVVSAKKVTLAVSGSVKLVHNGNENASDFVENVCIHSTSDVVIEGGGKLILKSVRSDAVTAEHTLTISGASLEAEAKFNAIRAGDKLVVSNSDVKLNAGRDGLVTENTAIGSDNARQGRILIDNSKLDVHAGYYGINAASYLDIKGEYTDAVITVSMNEEDGAGIAGSEMIAIENGDITVSAPRSGIYARKDVMYEDGSLSQGSFSMFDGSLHVNSNRYGIEAEKSIDIYGGSVELFDAGYGMKSDKIEIRDGFIRILVEHEAMFSEGTVHMFNGEIISRISGGDTPAKHNEFIMENGLVILETNNPNGVFGDENKCYFKGGTFICLGESYAMPRNSNEVKAVRFTNASFNPGKTYSFGDTEALLVEFPVTYGVYQTCWIGSNVFELNGKYRVVCKEDGNFVLTWTQSSAVTEVKVQG